ncbi:hypothetical protein SYNPS1DRAFT_23138 [Syncephalis pseudoplumigaleata]|uniref:Uncharacterized protein n=1 Tax=Syncephalis pseudoplumigaleata TaxID=1712513 RepID=A0A4P9YZ07_9FUNG|nr:hypothetical protein SYNPS1DRAFT_23138 [Syncephalis pseudoplumigaleata]|eukprot:RKP24812.1 hypothetical protein SYNPS1DRAFT_23138 [Syncephalis pseudoplumigaleata]
MSDRSGSYERTPDFEDGGPTAVATEFRVNLTSSSASSSHKNGYGASHNNYGKRTASWIDDGAADGSSSGRKDRPRHRDASMSGERNGKRYDDRRQLEHAVGVQLIYTTLMVEYVKSNGEPVTVSVLAEAMAKAQMLGFLNKLTNRVSGAIGQLQVARWISPDEKSDIGRVIEQKVRHSSEFFRMMDDVIVKFNHTDTRFASLLKDAYAEARRLVKTGNYARYWQGDKEGTESRSSETSRRSGQHDRDSSTHRGRYAHDDAYTSGASSQSQSQSQSARSGSPSGKKKASAWGEPLAVNKDTWSVWGEPQPEAAHSNWDTPSTDSHSGQSMRRADSPIHLRVGGILGIGEQEQRYRVRDAQPYAQSPHVAPHAMSSAISVSSNSPQGSPRLAVRHPSTIEIRDEDMTMVSSPRQLPMGMPPTPTATAVATPMMTMPPEGTTVSVLSTSSTPSSPHPPSVQAPLQTSPQLSTTMGQPSLAAPPPPPHSMPPAMMMPHGPFGSPGMGRGMPAMAPPFMGHSGAPPPQHYANAMPMPPHQSRPPPPPPPPNPILPHAASAVPMGALDETTLASAYLTELEQQHLAFLIHKIPIHEKDMNITIAGDYELGPIPWTAVHSYSTRTVQIEKGLDNYLVSCHKLYNIHSYYYEKEMRFYDGYVRLDNYLKRKITFKWVQPFPFLMSRLIADVAFLNSLGITYGKVAEVDTYVSIGEDGSKPQIKLIGFGESNIYSVEERRAAPTTSGGYVRFCQHDAKSVGEMILRVITRMKRPKKQIVDKDKVDGRQLRRYNKRLEELEKLANSLKGKKLPTLQDAEQKSMFRKIAAPPVLRINTRV